MAPEFGLGPNEYGWFPPHSGATLRATATTRAVVIEKPYICDTPAATFHGREVDLEMVALMGGPDVAVRCPAQRCRTGKHT